MDPTLTVISAPLPAGSRATRFYRAPNLADAFAVRLPDGATHDPELLARCMFATQAPWVARLMWWRDHIVALFGLKTSTQLLAAGATGGAPRISFFRIYEQDAHEILLGEDDRHLDFRVSVRVEPTDGATQVVTTTVVQCHNLLGRIYLLVIAPLHRMVVRSTLQRAARSGWPRKEA